MRSLADQPEGKGISTHYKIETMYKRKSNWYYYLILFLMLFGVSKCSKAQFQRVNASYWWLKNQQFQKDTSGALASVAISDSTAQIHLRGGVHANANGIYQDSAYQPNVFSGKTRVGPNVGDTSSLQVTRGDASIYGSLFMPNLIGTDVFASGTSEIRTRNGHHFLHTGNPDGNENFATYIGVDAGAAARNNTGPTQSITALGYGALQNIFNTNYRGVGLGAFASQSLTSGSGNTCIGNASGLRGTSYTNNVLIGSSAGIAITGGSSENTMIGTRAGGPLTLNTLSGGIATAVACTIIGSGSMASMSGVTADSLIVIGVGSAKNTNSGTIINTTIIGNNITTDLSNVVILGNNRQVVIFPQFTTTAKLAIASPQPGMQVFDITLSQMSYYNGTTWVNF